MDCKIKRRLKDVMRWPVRALNKINQIDGCFFICYYSLWIIEDEKVTFVIEQSHWIYNNIEVLLLRNTNDFSSKILALKHPSFWTEIIKEIRQCQFLRIQVNWFILSVWRIRLTRLRILEYFYLSYSYTT